MYEQDILIRKHPERLSDIQATRTINSHDTLCANWGCLTVQQFMYCKYDVQLASLSVTVSNRYVEYRVLNCVTILLLLLLFSIYIYIILLLSNLFIFIYNSVLKKKKRLIIFIFSCQNMAKNRFVLFWNVVPEAVLPVLHGLTAALRTLWRFVFLFFFYSRTVDFPLNTLRTGPSLFILSV